jgi:Arc/MetJ family transcription regulator
VRYPAYPDCYSLPTKFDICILKAYNFLKIDAKEVHTMRTTLNIPDNLMADLLAKTRLKSKTKAICIALEDYLYKKKVEGLLSLKGKIKINSNRDELDRLETEESKRNDKLWRDR